MLLVFPSTIVNENLLSILILTKKQLDHELKELNGKELYQTDSVKYLGICIDKNLN